MVKIGHASSDENGNSKNGTAGDQTSKEVYTRDWYLRSKGWTHVIRPKDADIAERIAKAMEDACLNDCIGYDQNQRTTLYEQAKKVHFDIPKITVKCECDCSSLVAVCVMAAGIDVSKDMYTGNELEILKKTGQFEILTDKKYTDSSDNLRRGDILLGAGHTAIVLSNGVNCTPKTTKADSGHSVRITADALNVRAGAGTSYKVIMLAYKGEVFHIDDINGKWGRLKGNRGWISLSYTEKI